MVEHGDAIPTMDGNASNIRLVSEETVVFDAAEHPQELELESEPNLQEDEEDEEDADNSEVSEEEEETEYTFQFQEEMDPLSFVEERDASGLQPYERFERIEHHYEVLAAKKRPALQESLSEMPAKRLRQEEILGASFEEIMETMNYGMRKRSRKNKTKGRRKGSRNKVKPEVSRKLGASTLHYAFGRFEEAICLLNEVILLAPNLSDPYHTLGLIYTAMGDKKKALNFYMIAAHLTPKDSSLWKLLVARSIEQGDKRQANYCLNKAIIADPHDIGLRFRRTSLYIELGEYLKAADSYEQISRLCPDDIEVLEKATQLYKKCGQRERAICMLEDSLKNHENVANLSVVDLLASVLMESNAYARALAHIERTQQMCVTGKEIPLHIIIKAGICLVHLGHLEKAKVKVKPRLSIGVLEERVKVLDYPQTGNVFHVFRNVASSADLSKASRAKKLLEKKVAKREEQKAAALAAGIDWKSDDSDDESPQVLQESPLPDFIKEEENHLLIIDLCKSLASSRRYWDALEIINLCLKLESNTLSVQTKEELQTLGAQVSYNIADPAHGWDCVRYIVSRHPYSFSAWSCYFKGILRNNRLSKRNKFLHNMRVKHKDSVPPILISAHRFTMISQHQIATREYLEAHKLFPDNPLINLCAGTALINLGIGHRLQNKHQTVLQGLAFLYNNAQLCEGSQEALYNIARAYHHVGLVSLAAKYYEKVLAIREKDYPIPTLPNDNPDRTDVKKPGYCDLRREAAYNLHLIYMKSGAFDLARQVLKDHVVL